jgi:hypothetical protein
VKVTTSLCPYLEVKQLVSALHYYLSINCITTSTRTAVPPTNALQWNDTDRGKLKYWETNTSHCRFVLHKSCTVCPMIEPGNYSSETWNGHAEFIVDYMGKALPAYERLKYLLASVHCRVDKSNVILMVTIFRAWCSTNSCASRLHRVFVLRFNPTIHGLYL